MYGSICIGFSAAGSVASRSFAEFLKSHEFSVIGHDCSQRVLMNNSLLEAVVSPPVSSPEYNDFLKEYISNHCDLYIPFLDDELETCAQLIKNDPKLRSKMSICSELAISVCNNKSTFKEWAQGLGLKTVPLATGVPAFIKPKVASGGKQGLLIHDQQVLDLLLNAYLLRSVYCRGVYGRNIIICRCPLGLFLKASGFFLSSETKCLRSF